MSGQEYLWKVLRVVVVVCIVALFAGQALGQPVLLSYVETGSMAPTLEPGDGFVAIPTELTGPVQRGDVVTFDAQKIEGGGLTTHRVVGKTAGGYVTQGDANSVTDQAGTEPPVQEAQIVSKALRVNGNVVVIPHFGTTVEGARAVAAFVQEQLVAIVGTRALGVQGVAYIVFTLSAIVYVADLWSDRGRARGRDSERSRKRDTGVSMHLVVLTLAGVVMLSATTAMVAPAGTEEFGVVSSTTESDRPMVIERGTTGQVDYIVPNSGIVPVYTYLEPGSAGVDIDPNRVVIQRRSTVNTTVELTAPREPGYYPKYVTSYRYLAVLPVSAIEALHRVHPWVPIVVIDAVLGGSIYLLGAVTLGTGRTRSRRREYDRVETNKYF